jgi:GT2 family glycosyltransferase
VTVVVVPRERFSYSKISLESIYANTDVPFHLVYVDGGSPAPIRRYLERKAKEKGFQLVRSQYVSPNQARNIGLRHVDTKYVLFVDNDVEVTPGWLSALMQCAEETNASLVGPLYCIGPPVHEIVHMAGGEAHILEKEGLRRLYEKLRFCDQRVSDVRPQLRREPCELLEFHCMLARRSVFEELGPLDEALLGTREHVDLCLTVREAGGTVWFEPNAVTSHVLALSYAWSDIPYYLLRWSDLWGQSSLRHFEQKWNLDANSKQLTSDWLRPHRQVPLLKWRRRLRRLLGATWGDHLVDALEDFWTGKASGGTGIPVSEKAADVSL